MKLLKKIIGVLKTSLKDYRVKIQTVGYAKDIEEFEITLAQYDHDLQKPTGGQKTPFTWLIKAFSIGLNAKRKPMERSKSISTLDFLKFNSL